MIVPDVNLLLYANIMGARKHALAREWWIAALNGNTTIGLGHPALFGFIRISTNPRIVRPALAIEHAITRVESWLERPQVELLGPGPRHLEIAFELLRELGTGANLTTDVQLAALAIENQAELHSNDADFGRFRGLRWVNPLS